MFDRALWLVFAAGHMMPVLSVFRPGMLEQLYGLALQGDLATLMRHRGALFLAVVIVAVWCAFDPRVRMLGLAVLSTSLIGFLALYLIGGSSPGLRQIALVDVALIPILAIAAFRTISASNSGV
jgi:hypothetical protein